LLPLQLQLFAAAVLLAFLIWVVHLIRRHQLSLRDSLLWFLSTGAALGVTLFPAVLEAFATALGIVVPSNALFALAFLYVLLNLLGVTIAISGNATRIRRLAQECTILRAELHALQARLERDERAL
jgi:hypothetical protein